MADVSPESCQFLALEGIKASLELGVGQFQLVVAGAGSHVPAYRAQQLHAHVKSFKEQLLQLRA